MEIEYRKLTRNEVDRLIEIRILQLIEEGATEEFDLRPYLKEFYDKHMSDGTFVSWLAYDEGRIIATSGMSFVEKPPYYSCPSGRIGLLTNMYTQPEYRRKGIAKKLIDRVIEEAREYGCGVVQITGSNAGVKLYTAYGFEHNNNFMQYKLNR